MPVTETQLETSLSFRGNSKISLPSALPLDSQALSMILHLNWPWTFCIRTPDIVTSCPFHTKQSVSGLGGVEPYRQH